MEEEAGAGTDHSGAICQGGLVIPGLAGSGKTNLLAHIMGQLIEIPCISFWTFETAKQSFRSYFGDHVLVIPRNLIRFNRWLEPPKTDPIAYHIEQTDVMAASYGFMGKGRQLFHRIVHEMDVQFGINKGSPYRWTDLDLLAKIIELLKQGPKSFEEREALTRCRIRLEPYAIYPEIVASDRCFDLPRMISQNVIYELHGLPKSIQLDLILGMLKFKMFYRQYSPEAFPVVNLNCIDDAQAILTLEKETRSGTYLIDLMKTGREYGETLAIADQNPKNLTDFMSIAHTVCIMQQSHFTTKYFQINTTMPYDQVDCLPNQKVGEAVILLPLRPPTQIRIPFHGTPRRKSDQEIEREMSPRLEAFLIESLRAKYEPATVAHSEQDLWHQRKREIPVTPDERKKWEDFIRYIAENPFAGVARIFQAIEVHREPGYRIISSLQKLKFIEGPIQLPSQGGGRRRKVFIVTYEGCKFARLDWNKMRLRGKGGLISKVYSKIIYDHLQNQGRSPEYEYSLKVGSLRKQCDVVDLNDANPIAFEFENTLNSHIITNLELNARVGFSKTIVVCKNQDEKDRILDYLVRNLPSKYWQNVDIKPIKDFL